MNAGLTSVAIVAVVVATCGIGLWGMRLSRTTSDFMVASRTVSTAWNASAISGEYLSAASFLGVAGLVMTYGVDMLWYPVGFVAGYLVLLLLVAAPLRRSGAYTLADFAETRLGSRSTRRLAGLLVVAIAWLYLLPQLQGAGLTLRTVTGAPQWAGAVIVAGVVVGNVFAGGMRSITLVQAFQYWLKMFAVAVPALVLLAVWRHDGSASLTSPDFPTFRAATVVHIQSSVRLDVTAAQTVVIHGVVDEQRRDGVVLLTPGEHDVDKGSTLDFPAGAAVPHADGVPRTTGAAWATPFGGDQGSHPLYRIYSLIFATFLGTMGLPHVLVRFYTNPDGRAARRTTVVVIGLLGAFYLFPAVFGALGRLYTPQLLLTGQTDAVVLLLPGAAIGGTAGQVFGAVVAAGAFAAFLSTSSGLVVSVAGVVAQDLLGGTVRSFRQGTLLAGAVPLALTFAATQLPVSEVVAMAFAVAASSFCPLLLLGIWWRGLTAAGATAGLVIGGGAAVVAVSLRIGGYAPPGWPSALLAQPAAVTVPLAFATMIAVSLLSRQSRPADVTSVMMRMHAPELSAT
jgi:Na+(H+)/acetate symporter ActP